MHTLTNFRLKLHFIRDKMFLKFWQDFIRSLKTLSNPTLWFDNLFGILPKKTKLQ